MGVTYVVVGQNTIIILIKKLNINITKDRSLNREVRSRIQVKLISASVHLMKLKIGGLPLFNKIDQN